jgi:hypothetical protein
VSLCALAAGVIMFPSFPILLPIKRVCGATLGLWRRSRSWQLAVVAAFGVWCLCG